MLNLTVLWLIAGVILCLTEFVFPTAFVTFMMGISAFITAAIALVIPQFSLLAALWLGLSTLLIVLSRRWFTPKRRNTSLGDDSEGETITAIAPGQTGRVLYEGNSWRAKCADNTIEIYPGEKVYIVGKQGNTLIVLPAKLLNA